MLMENYIGAKVVKAAPKQMDGQLGYSILYEDGYSSWCPKETFEKTYRKLDCEGFIKTTLTAVM